MISKREEIAAQAQELLQKELDEAETGISVSTIEMKRTNVPEPVQPSFNEVNQATQEKEKMIYQAREEYNKSIPQAKGRCGEDDPGGRRVCDGPGEQGQRGMQPGSSPSIRPISSPRM